VNEKVKYLGLDLHCGLSFTGCSRSFLIWKELQSEDVGAPSVECLIEVLGMLLKRSLISAGVPMETIGESLLQGEEVLSGSS